MTEDTEARENEEWIKFGVLAGVMAVVVLTVFLIRPLVFGHIIPVIMGEGIVITAPVEELVPQILVPAIIEEPAATPRQEEPSNEVEAVAEPAEADTAEAAPAAEPAEAVPESAVEEAPEAALSEESAPQPEAAIESVQSALPLAAPLVHRVKTGDTLIGIAAQYNVTVDQIVAANGLLSANYINIGDDLVIPQQ